MTSSWWGAARTGSSCWRRGGWGRASGGAPAMGRGGGGGRGGGPAESRRPRRPLQRRQHDEPVCRVCRGGDQRRRAAEALRAPPRVLGHGHGGGGLRDG